MLQFPDPASENENSLRQPSDPLKRPWYRLRPQTFALLVRLILAAGILERFPFTNEYTAFTPYTDQERGVPFVYHRVRLQMDNPPTTTFDSMILVLDLLLIGAAIAETTYWFEKWQRRKPLHLQTLCFFLALIVIAAIVELYPFSGRLGNDYRLSPSYPFPFANPLPKRRARKSAYPSTMPTSGTVS